jgi:outer membrane lipopolysaccharide assembly protein LptE/RlpB
MMIITNDTLMWLAPAVGAAVMTATVVVTGYFDTHRPAPASDSEHENLTAEMKADLMARVTSRSSMRPNFWSVRLVRG